MAVPDSQWAYPSLTGRLSRDDWPLACQATGSLRAGQCQWPGGPGPGGHCQWPRQILLVVPVGNFRVELNFGIAQHCQCQWQAQAVNGTSLNETLAMKQYDRSPLFVPVVL